MSSTLHSRNEVGSQLVDAPPSGDHAVDAARMFVARWELDISRVRLLIERVAANPRAEDEWVDKLINGTRISNLDERAAQVVGAPVGRSEMLGQPVASFAPPDSWAILADLIVRVATDSPGHALRSNAINSFMLRDARLKVWGARGAGIPERINIAVEGELADDRSPWAVRASEARYRRLLHHLPTALLQVDARELDSVFHRLRAEGVIDLRRYIEVHDGLVQEACGIVRVTDANESALQLIGAASAQALSRPVAYLFAQSPDAAAQVIIAHFEGKRSHSELIKLETFDGRILDVQLSVTYPNPPERLDVTLISLEDVTDRLCTESQLRQLQADYSRATRIATLGELASSIAHEVNQPLAAIVMNAETSLRWLKRDEPNMPKVTQLTERIAQSARHASEIVQRIRGMASKHAPERVPLDLSEVAREALLFVRHDLETRAIRLVTSFASRSPAIIGNRVQLQQVIVNLLVNAIQAVAQQEPRRRVIELATSEGEDGQACLAVRDQGPGIAPENLDRIFEGFFTTKDDGMGIGLAVCQSIINAHGGTITASNEDGGGAMFCFSLPPDPPAG